MTPAAKVRQFVHIAAAIAALVQAVTATLRAQEIAGYRTANVKVLAICQNQVDYRCRLEVSDFTRRSDGANLASVFLHGVGSKIPYGIYEARMYFADAWPVIPLVSTVEVSQPDVRLVFDLRPRETSEVRDALNVLWGSPDWPQLEGPHCVRSKCYVDAIDTLQR